MENNLNLSHNILDFKTLADSIRQLHSEAQSRALNAVNKMATLRNWLIGYYIVEYEQHGNDRADYGDRLLKRLETAVNTKGMNETLFKNARTFYTLYPSVRTLFGETFSAAPTIRPTASDELQYVENDINTIRPSLSDEFQISPNELVGKLSFSHICEILPISDAFERYFYETECIRCGWSVRELRRQIASNLFLRAGISRSPQKLLEMTKMGKQDTTLAIRDPFTFEFLGLDAKEVVSEKDLENSLILHLQDFLLELGKGFCFEARQKRIVIDDRYYFADLVFYNRLLHCNVIVELKNDEFHHEYLGQLNAYVSYYKENEMVAGDNPPIGILLCTHKGPKMVEYAIAGMDNHLFVSTYLLQLPDKKVLEDFLIKQNIKEE